MEAIGDYEEFIQRSGVQRMCRHGANRLLTHAGGYMEKHHNVLVAVSRQTASGGGFIAYSAAKELGFKYLDDEVLYRAIQFMGADERELFGREERINSFIEKVALSSAFGSQETIYAPSARPFICDMDVFEVEAKIIREVAKSYSAVIVGNAGFHVLREHPGLVKVFVHAPLGFRVKHLMEGHHISDRDSVTEEIKKADCREEKFLQTLDGASRTDARNYHLCIDSSAMTFEKASAMIVELVKDLKRYAGV